MREVKKSKMVRVRSSTSESRTKEQTSVMFEFDKQSLPCKGRIMMSLGRQVCHFLAHCGSKRKILNPYEP